MAAAPAACQCLRLRHGRMLSASVGGSSHEPPVATRGFQGHLR